MCVRRYCYELVSFKVCPCCRSVVSSCLWPCCCRWIYFSHERGAEHQGDAGTGQEGSSSRPRRKPGGRHHQPGEPVPHCSTMTFSAFLIERSFVPAPSRMKFAINRFSHITTFADLPVTQFSPAAVSVLSLCMNSHFYGCISAETLKVSCSI